MKDPRSGVNAWSQPALIAPPAVTVHLRIGVMGDANHVQAMVEVVDETTGDLLAMESWPHRDLERADGLIRMAALRAINLALDYVPPFP